MNTLLDTHTPLWPVSDPSRVAAPALAVLGRAGATPRRQAPRRNLAIATRDARMNGAAMTPILAA